MSMRNTATPPRHPEPEINRRQFLRLLSGISLFGVCPSLHAQTTNTKPLKRRIPSSGELLPVIGLGTARTFDIEPSSREDVSRLREVMRAFYQGSGRLVDSSPMYGNAEAVVGQLASGLGIADELFMATKVWTRGEYSGIQQMTRSETRMGGGPLELIQVHNLVDTETHLRTLRHWKESGRIRYIGVTHYTDHAHDRLVKLCETQPLDFIQFNYNLIERNAEQRLLPAARENGIATLINKPYLQGSLFRQVHGQPLPPWAMELGIRSWGQYFLKFIISHPAVTCAIPATGKPTHARDNAAAAYGELPTPRQRRRMLDYFLGL